MKCKNCGHKLGKDQEFICLECGSKLIRHTHEKQPPRKDGAEWSEIVCSCGCVNPFPESEAKKESERK